MTRKKTRTSQSRTVSLSRIVKFARTMREKQFSKAWWVEIVRRADKSKDLVPRLALDIILDQIREYIKHLEEQKYLSSKAIAARKENAKKAGRPKGSKNNAPRSDKGVKRTRRTVEDVVDKRP